MTANSKIEWTDFTWNPTRGCSLQSPGCTNCYAMKQAHRFSGLGAAYEGLTKLTAGGPVWTGKVATHPELLDAPLRLVMPHRIFVNSMSDLFHPEIPFEFIADVFAVMACTMRHTYQVLTKQADRMLEFFRWLDMLGGWPEQVQPTKVWPQWIPCRDGRGGYDNCGPAWPLENVWLGVSAEDQTRANARISKLLAAPAAVRFLSIEPILGDVDLMKSIGGTRWIGGQRGCAGKTHRVHHHDELCGRGIDWVIVGGESGPKARTTTIGHIRGVVIQCQLHGVPVFVKQLGRFPVNREGVPHPLRDRKGGDPAEWPGDLRVREFP